jgi:cell division protease FtsH
MPCNRFSLLPALTPERALIAHLADADEVREELQQMIEILCQSQRFEKLGGRILKGVLLVGTPCTARRS